MGKFLHTVRILHRPIKPSISYAQQAEVLASTVFSRMIIECHSLRENWRESQRVCSSISLVRDYSVFLVIIV